jgi:integrase
MSDETTRTAPQKRGRKRPAGEGSYRERKDGTWECRITLPNGQRKSFYGATQAEVIKKRKEAERELERGRDLSKKSETVESFMRRWLDDVARPTIRPKTYESYAQLLRLHILPALGRIKLEKLKPADVQRLMADMSAKGLSPRTVQYVRAIIRRALGHAVKWGLVAQNVATLVDPPRTVRKSVVPLDADGARRFLNAAREQEPRLWPFFATAIYTGLRQAELLGLRWRDVNLSNGTLRVSATLQRINKEWTFVEPKTKRSARTLSLPAAAIDALKEQRDRQAFERKTAANLWIDRDLVFTTPKGTPLEPSNVSKKLHALLEEAGLPKQGMHALRHCCASLLLAQGVSPRVVMEQLGHTQISVTMDIYSHVMPAMLKNAADALDDALRQRG